MTHQLHSFGLMALGTRFRVLSEQIMAFVKTYYQTYSYDFEPRWYPLFQLLYLNQSLSPMALAQKFGVSHATVNMICKALVERELIQIETDLKDARGKNISLTNKGHVLFIRLKPAWFALELALTEAFGEAGAQVLQSLNLTQALINDKQFERGLEQFFQPATILDQVSIIDYDSGNPDHKLYFAALNIEWLETYFSVEPVDYAMFADPYAAIIAQGGCIKLALVGPQIVGIGALIKRSQTIYELAKMAVSLPFQGKGIGAKLVEALTDEARALGLEKLYLVSSTILPHAVRSYRKLGFVDSPLDLHGIYARSDITLEKAL
jgi:putative acetyltransferase